MTDKTAELRELAQAARRIDESELTRYEHGGGRLIWEKDGQRELIADFYDKTYREFYAALKPSVVLALLERLSAPAVGEGWQTVPNNTYRITDEMAQAGHDAGQDYLAHNQSALVYCKVIFEAMCAAAPKPPPAQGDVCKWTENDDGQWETACGEMWEFIHAGPAENGTKFCCYCGKALATERKP